MMNVAVYGTGYADHSSIDILLNKMVGNVSDVSHALGAANKDQTGQVQLFANSGNLFSALIVTDLLETTANVVNTTKVDKVLESFTGHRDKLIV